MRKVQILIFLDIRKWNQVLTRFYNQSNQIFFFICSNTFLSLGINDLAADQLTGFNQIAL